MAIFIKNVTTYQKTKSIYGDYRQTQNKDSYRSEHEHEIILHEAAVKALQVTGVSGKFPNVAALQAQYESSSSRKKPYMPSMGKSRNSQGIRRYQAKHRRHFAAR